MSRRRGRTTLDERLQALADAVDHARGRAPDELLEKASAVLRRAGQRRAVGEASVVVALCGGTGTGKSTLFNAITGTALADAGVTRPTTSDATAWTVGDPDEFTQLLNWLEIRPERRHHAPSDAGADGLVLVDLPDMDSVVTANRDTADRLIERVDVLVWVTDPNKYAQQSLHEGYLARLQEHADVTLVVLNQADLLDRKAQTICKRDLERLLEPVGGPRVLVTSAATGDGVGQLRAVLAKEVGSRRAVAERIAADVRTAAGELLEEFAVGGGATTAGTRARTGSGAHGVTLDTDSLVRALVDESGVQRLGQQAERAYVTASKRVLRSPTLATLAMLAGPIRRLMELLARPLRALAPVLSRRGRRRRQDPGGPTAATPLAVRHVLGDLLDQVRRNVPWFWSERITQLADEVATRLPLSVKSVLADVQLEPTRRRWWAMVRVARATAEAAVLVGLIWATLVMLTVWWQLPQFPSPTIGDRVSVVPVLIIGGAAVSMIAGLLARLAVPKGARRHRAEVEDAALDSVRTVVRDTAVAPLQAELDAYSKTHKRLAMAAS